MGKYNAVFCHNGKKCEESATRKEWEDFYIDFCDGKGLILIYENDKFVGVDNSRFGFGRVPFVRLKKEEVEVENKQDGGDILTKLNDIVLDAKDAHTCYELVEVIKELHNRISELEIERKTIR